MAYDEGLAQILRDDLADQAGITEKKMFGGIAFLLNGNMVCGIHQGGAMFRVGKEREEDAMAISGAGPMMFTGRKMGGMIDVEDSAFVDDDKRQSWLDMSLANAASLPPK